MSSKGKLYFHINNGGVTFAVEDNGNGPEVVVSANHFSHQVARTALMTTSGGLKALGEFFLRLSEGHFSPPSCVAAEHPRDPDAPREPLQTGVYSGSGGALGEARPVEVPSLGQLRDHLERAAVEQALNTVGSDPRRAVELMTVANLTHQP